MKLGKVTHVIENFNLSRSLCVSKGGRDFSIRYLYLLFIKNIIMKFPSSIFGGQFVMKNYYSLGLSVAFIAVLAMVPHNAFSKKSKLAYPSCSEKMSVAVRAAIACWNAVVIP